MEHDDHHTYLKRVHAHSQDVLRQHSLRTLPDPLTIAKSRSELLESLPEQGVGIAATTDHLLQSIAPALNGGSLSPNYYGFVIGGITPAARVGEAVVSLYDQNPSVHLPDQTVASNVEDRALRLLMDLFQLDQQAWSGVLTTGATASNILGLACGREFTIDQRIESRLEDSSQANVGSVGLLRACRVAGVDEINIYTTMAHSSLYKAASVLGLGRACVQHVGLSDNDVTFDIQKLERFLEASTHNSVSIVVISCAEVNTGFFATHGHEEVHKLRSLCDKYSAWLHVDGAFGFFARLLPGSSEFHHVSQGGQGLELADSIAGDGHKLLNVPYDCGFFFCRHPNISQQVFQNPNAAYLNTKNAATDTIQSPLNIGLENSRRFRGLPVYASLMAYGKDGYTDMLTRQIRFARAVATYIFNHDAFELLPREIFTHIDRISQDVFIIVLFKARNDALNERLVQEINESSKVYVSGTVWNGSAASRIAVSNWQVDPERDYVLVKEVLERILKEWKGKI